MKSRPRKLKNRQPIRSFVQFPRRSVCFYSSIFHPPLVANIAQPKQRPNKRVFRAFSHKLGSESLRFETSKMRLGSRKPKQLSNMP